MNFMHLLYQKKYTTVNLCNEKLPKKVTER
jgi:hypothetical protein